MIRRLGFVLAIVALVSGAGLLLRAEPPQEVGTWASIGTAPENRIGAAAVALPDGRTLIAGGLANGTPTAAVVVFDPTDSSFATAGQLLEPRAGHTATLLDDGRVLIAGGTVNELLTGDLEIFDPSTGTSVLTASLAELRSGHAAARLGDGKVLIAGGTGTDGGLQTAEIFDPETGAVAFTLSPLQSPRAGASATTLIDGRVLIAGGSNGTQDLASAEIYNPSTESFQPTDTNLDAPRSAHTAVLLPHNNSVLIAGGTSDGVPLATADLFLPAQFPDPFTYGMGQFALTGEMAAARSGASGGPHIEGYAFIVGGGQADAEVYRFATIKTDKDDYAPGEAAIITGSGWEPNEEVTLLFQEDPAVHVDYTFTVNADGEGNIYWDQWAPEEHDLHVRFYLMARGSRSRAQTTFTDGNVRVKTVGTSGTPATISWTRFQSLNCTGVTLASGTISASTSGNGTDIPGGTNANESLRLTAQALSGFAFSNWSGGNISPDPNTSNPVCVPHQNATRNIDANYVVSTGTSTAVASSVNPSVFGQAVTFTATVSPTSGSSAPAGSVQFKIDGVNFGSAVNLTPVGSNGVATSAATSSLSVGNHTVQAVYSPTGSFAGSTGTLAGGQVVNKANTTTTITSDSPDPSVVGQLVTIAYSVAVVAPGAGTPTGTVTVSDGTQSCTATVAAGSCQIAFTSAGARTLTATYAGDSNFNGSASAAEPHQVDKANTTTTIISDTPDPSVVGQLVTIAYSVAVVAPGAGTPTGNVTVSDGTESCVGTVAAGSCAITFTTAGVKSLTATYAGDSNFNGSASAAEPHQVDKANTTTTIISDTPDPSVVGQLVTIAYAVAVVAPGAGTPTGNVTVSDGTESCVGTVAAGSCAITFTTAGVKSLTATYAGDSNFNGSASAAEPHQVDKANTTTTIISDTPDPSVVGQLVTIAYAVAVVAPGAGTPTGNVTVSDGTESCTATVAAGSCQIAFTSAGAKSLTATYAGDSNFNGSASAAEPHQVDKANTTTTITSDSPDPSVVGQAVTVSYTVTVNAPGSGTPTGTVTVSDGTESCVGTVAAGSCAITFTTAGAKSLTATYAGDSNFNGSASAAEPHQVDKANTTTTITSDNPDPSVVGQLVTIAYSVAVVAPGAGTPTGTVTVSDGTESCTATVAAGSCQITFTSAGTKSLTATYAGDSNFNGSASAAEPHQVDKANTTTTIISDTPDPSVVGQLVTVSYTVAVVAPGAGTPTGNVTVSDGTESCTATVAAGSCQITFTSAGAKSLTATYAGDSNFNGSASAAEPHQVDKANTTTTITGDSPDPSVVGQLVTIAYAVAVVAPGAGTPTGNVSVSDGTESCTATVAAGSCQIAFTSAGTKSLTATYAGDSNFNGSASAAEPHQVDKANTTTTITSDSPDPSVVGQLVTIAYSVAVVAPGAGTPTGNVTVSDGTESCTATVAAGSCQIAFTSAGTKSLTATYAGDSNFNGSASAAEPHQVDKANTTTTIISDTPDPSVVGQLVTIAYSAAVVAPGAGTPTGSVTVSDGTESCTATVAAGSCQITFTSAGTKSLTATYAGDSNFNGSASAAEPHQVDKANTTTTITSDSPDPSVVGQLVTIAYAVAVVAPGAGTPTGNVTVSDGIESCTATVAAGSCQITFTSAGTKSLTATYAGDSNFNGSASAAEPHQVDKANTTTTITSDSPDPSVVGQLVTIAYSVAVVAPGAGTPTGNVTVSDGTESCTATVAAGSCQIAFTSAGTKSLTATYAGDSNFNGSASAAEPHQVDKANTTTTIISDTPDPSVVGQLVTIAYSVAVVAPGAGTPTGNVTVSDGTQSCTATVAAGSCQIAFTSAGARTLTATYAGDTNFNGSADTEGHQVNKANTTTTILSDNPDPSLVGQPYTVSGTVTVNSPGAGTPTGIVTVTGASGCVASVAGDGTWSCAVTSTTAGAKTLLATYGGDGNFNGSSDTEAHSVQYQFSGFFAPVDNLPTVNNAKAGQAIPTKWRLTAFSGAPVSDPASFVSLIAYPVTCGVWSGVPADALPEVASGSSGLQYLGDGHWQFNWKTPKNYANLCMIARVTLNDGTFHEYNVKFKP